jgi:hypothetical protein
VVEGTGSTVLIILGNLCSIVRSLWDGEFVYMIMIYEMFKRYEKPASAAAYPFHQSCRSGYLLEW